MKILFIGLLVTFLVTIVSGVSLTQNNNSYILKNK